MNISLAVSYTSSQHAYNTTGHDPRAAKLFDRAYRNPCPTRFQQWLGRTIQPLLHLDDVLAHGSLNHRHHDGTRAIAVNQIHGTLNRGDDFDYNFRPLKNAIQQRWRSVATAMMHEISLPPIEVIQIGEAYFVKDGHHRISVARALGCDYLDAVVEVWH
ncbi:MAG: hypothetical protein JXA10_12955 [Anaerolineae bacterium]|nr:hypothetical protein [Anaerolineae bacterium]